MQPKLPVPGDIVGDRYLIERPLAEGGMGAVYVARHKHTEAIVALKVLREEASGDAMTRMRFVRESKVAAALGHPGIVKVFDAGEDPVVGPYLAMELLEGEPLDAYLNRASPVLEERLAIVREMLEPLAAAHEAGIVHRDVKPENVFLASDGEGGVRVKLLDFGIARVQHATTQTSDGSALGTIYYMAPEQMLDAGRASTAADVWSVGVMMFELIADVLPFDGQTIHEVAVRVCTAPMPSLLETVPSVNPELAAVVHACLDRDVANRPQNARALAEMFDAVGIVAPRTTRVSVVASPRPSLTPAAPRSVVPSPMTATKAASDSTIEVGPDGARAARRDSVAIEAPPTALDRRSRAPSRKSVAPILIACALFAVGIGGALTVRSIRSERAAPQAARSPSVATPPSRPQSLPSPAQPSIGEARPTPAPTRPAPVEQAPLPSVVVAEPRLAVRPPTSVGVRTARTAAASVARAATPVSTATATGPAGVTEAPQSAPVVARAPEPAPTVVQPAQPTQATQPTQPPRVVTSTQPAQAVRPAQPVVQPRPAAQPVRRPAEGEDEAPLSF
jgi:serine/threonine protein kinase